MCMMQDEIPCIGRQVRWQLCCCSVAHSQPRTLPTRYTAIQGMDILDAAWNTLHWPPSAVTTLVLFCGPKQDLIRAYAFLSTRILHPFSTTLCLAITYVQRVCRVSRQSEDRIRTSRIGSQSQCKICPTCLCRSRTPPQRTSLSSDVYGLIRYVQHSLQFAYPLMWYICM